MSTSYLVSENESTNSSPWVSVWRDGRHGMIVKENDGCGWSSDDMVL
jgi:hypothetical protein